MPERSDYPEERRNRCATCGFLAKRLAGHPRVDPILEASLEDRQTGSLWQGLGASTEPYCFVGAADPSLAAEVLDGTDSDAPARNVHDRTLAVIERERDGSAWFPWTQHMSPRDHLDRRNMLQLERDRADLQVRLAEMQVDSLKATHALAALTAEATKNNAATTEALLRLQEKSEGFATTWTYIAATLAAVAVLIGACSYLAPDAGTDLVRRLQGATPAATASPAPSIAE